MASNLCIVSDGFLKSLAICMYRMQVKHEVSSEPMVDLEPLDTRHIIRVLL